MFIFLVFRLLGFGISFPYIWIGFDEDGMQLILGIRLMNF